MPLSLSDYLAVFFIIKINRFGRDPAVILDDGLLDNGKAFKVMQYFLCYN